MLEAETNHRVKHEVTPTLHNGGYLLPQCQVRKTTPFKFIVYFLIFLIHLQAELTTLSNLGVCQSGWWFRSLKVRNFLYLWVISFDEKETLRSLDLTRLGSSYHPSIYAIVMSTCLKPPLTVEKEAYLKVVRCKLPGDEGFNSMI